MARTFPRTLSTRAEITKSERDLFDLLADRLGKDWNVFHSSALLIPDGKDGARMREADFVLAHPGHGIFCLEVKGHGVEQSNGEWFRADRDGTRTRIEDPFAQAADERYALGRLLRRTAAGAERRSGWGTPSRSRSSPSPGATRFRCPADHRARSSRPQGAGGRDRARAIAFHVGEREDELSERAHSP